MKRFTVIFSLQEAETEWGLFSYFSQPWVCLALELASIPRHGDCPVALLGTSMSWKAFQLRQFSTEQLLGTAGPV